MKIDKASQSWGCPAYQVNDEIMRQDVLDPAERCVKEFMQRMPLIEMARSMPLVSSTFEDMGNFPTRFTEISHPTLSEETIIKPFSEKKEGSNIVAYPNPEYQKAGLLQISQRVKSDRKGPRFETVIKKEGLHWNMVVSMLEFDTDDYDIAVTRFNGYETVWVR